jgi:hypothetical protein
LWQEGIFFGHTDQMTGISYNVMRRFIALLEAVGKMPPELAADVLPLIAGNSLLVRTVVPTRPFYFAIDNPQ